MHQEFDSIHAASVTLSEDHFSHLNSQIQTAGADNEHGIRYIGVLSCLGVNIRAEVSCNDAEPDGPVSIQQS